MIRWSEIAPLLKTIFTQISADPARDATRYSAEWKEGQRSLVSPDQRYSVLLKLTTVVGLGVDEFRKTYTDPSSTDPADAPYLGSLRMSITGQRKFTVQVQVHSVDRSDDTMAMVPLDRIRLGLSFPSVAQRLLDADVSIIDIRQSVKANYKDDNRVVSCASMDVVFGASVWLDDPVPMGWIEQIVYSSHFSDVDGIEMPVPPNVVDMVVPPDTGTPGALQANTGSGLLQDNPTSGLIDVRIPAGA